MTSRSPSQRFLVFGAILAGCGVAAGAFGAHALKEILDAPMLQVFETATRYVMYTLLDCVSFRGQSIVTLNKVLKNPDGSLFSGFSFFQAVYTWCLLLVSGGWEP